MLRVDGRTRYAHRLAYEFAVGVIPDGACIDHRTTCPKSCVNPAHLRLATPKQNAENRIRAPRGISRYALADGTERWVAKVQHNSRRIYVGSFATMEEASEAARLKRIELFTHNDLDRIPAP